MADSGIPQEYEFVEHEVEVVLAITTTVEDVQDALARSGLREGDLIGEALIGSVTVYSPAANDA